MALNPTFGSVLTSLSMASHLSYLPYSTPPESENEGTDVEFESESVRVNHYCPQFWSEPSRPLKSRSPLLAEEQVSFTLEPPHTPSNVIAITGNDFDAPEGESALITVGFFLILGS